MGDLCACMTFVTVRVRVENIRTSPPFDAGAGEEPEAFEFGEGTGEGYAR